MPIDYFGAKKAVQRQLFDGILDMINELFSPDDVYDEVVLSQWALDNGFIRESDCPEAE